MRHPTAACCALLVGLLATPTLAGSTLSAEEAAPIGLTASLERVPTLDATAVPEPYKLDWQRRVQAFQLTFEAQLAGDAFSSNVDPIETGSINAAR